MLNLFKTREEQPVPPDWIRQANATKERWFVFLDKLEERMKALCADAIPELKAMRQNAVHLFDGNIYQVHSGIAGQLMQMQQKARDTYEEKIMSFYYQLEQQLNSAGNYSGFAFDFREACQQRSNQFDALLDEYRQQLARAMKNDNEALYQKILEEHEQIKDQFRCRQCGAPIALDKIYFTTSYLKCPACSTQNTYEPSTLARSLNHIARELAEERTAHLLAEYNEAANPDPDQYRKYLRALFDEWNKLVPDLAESNEKFFQARLKEFNKTVI
ncbi:MAG TPA: hypothetical protein VF421_01465 [Niabella sp.]